MSTTPVRPPAGPQRDAGKPLHPKPQPGAFERSMALQARAKGQTVRVCAGMGGEDLIVRGRVGWYDNYFFQLQLMGTAEEMEHYKKYFGTTTVAFHKGHVIWIAIEEN